MWSDHASRGGRRAARASETRAGGSCAIEDRARCEELDHKSIPRARVRASCADRLKAGRAVLARPVRPSGLPAGPFGPAGPPPHPPPTSYGMSAYSARCARHAHTRVCAITPGPHGQVCDCPWCARWLWPASSLGLVIQFIRRDELACRRTHHLGWWGLVGSLSQMQGICAWLPGICCHLGPVRARMTRGC